jgi:hypothetical protein
MDLNNLVNWNGTKKFNPEEQYEWRLKWLADTIKKREDRGEKISDAQKLKWEREERHTYESSIKDLDKIEKLNKDTCIVIPTHFYQSVWLRACIESLKPLGYYIICLYDNPFFEKNHTPTSRMPSTQTFMLMDQMIMKPKTWCSGVSAPHYWHMYLGMKMVHALGFKWVFSLNGDCILEKPENFYMLQDMIKDKDADAIACEHNPGIYFGTLAYLMKVEPALKMWEKIFEMVFRYNAGNAESRMGYMSKELNLNIVPVENPEDHHFKPPGVLGTFRKTIGLRHLHAEHKVRRSLKLEPIEEKYFEKGLGNQFLNHHERATLDKYWETKDKKYLEAWWGNGVVGVGEKTEA